MVMIMKAMLRANNYMKQCYYKLGKVSTGLPSQLLLQVLLIHWREGNTAKVPSHFHSLSVTTANSGDSPNLYAATMSSSCFLERKDKISTSVSSSVPKPCTHTYAWIVCAHTRSGQRVWGQRAHRHGLLKAIGVVFLRRHQQAEQQSGQISSHSLLHSSFQVLEHSQNYYIILAGAQMTERNEALWGTMVIVISF